MHVEQFGETFQVRVKLMLQVSVLSTLQGTLDTHIQAVCFSCKTAIAAVTTFLKNKKKIIF